MNHCLGRSPPNLVGYGEHTYVDQTVVIIPCGRPSRVCILGPLPPPSSPFLRRPNSRDSSYEGRA